MKLTYEKITRENVDVAIEILKEAFSVVYGSPALELLAYLGGKSEISLQPYLVLFEGKPVGTVGLYELDERDEIWLWYYCVRTEYRGRGFGKRILQDSIEMARTQKGKNVLRVWTYSVWNAAAQAVYRQLMPLCEDYTNPNDDKRLIEEGKPLVYSMSFDGSAILPWSNRFLDLGYEWRQHNVFINLEENN